MRRVRVTEALIHVSTAETFAMQTCQLSPQLQPNIFSFRLVTSAFSCGDMPKLTEWEKASGMRNPAGGKIRLPVCHLCGREFGTASIKIHMKACAEKYEREKGKPAPPPPDMLSGLTSGDRPIKQADWDAYNEQAQAVAEGEMEPCPLCARTFANKERLSVHLRSCTGPREPRAKTERTPPPKSTTNPVAKLVRSASGALRGVGGGSSSKAPSPPPPANVPTKASQSSSSSPSNGKSAKERMKELQELLDATFISQEEYDQKRAEILASL